MQQQLTQTIHILSRNVAKQKALTAAARMASCLLIFTVAAVTTDPDTYIHTYKFIRRQNRKTNLRHGHRVTRRQKQTGIGGTSVEV